MPTFLRPLLELWQRLTLGQRATLVFVLAVVIAIAAGTVSYTTRPVYTTLYSGLSGKDAAQIVDKLRDQKVPFEVSRDGGTIKVPEDVVAELRLDFAGAGLPRSGEIGYELFDKPMLGMTDFVQQMNLHRALEGELARSITELDAVEGARVHLVVPTARLFKEDQKPATASIVLQLKPGAMLTPQQVQGISYMTAFSVEGLTVENITIVDSRGNLLGGRPSRSDLAGLSATQLEVQRSVEQDLEEKALALLENTLGPGRAQVKVTARLNWDRVERTVEDYSAERTATLSEERQESSGGEELGGGTSERSITNYQVPHTVEKQVPEVGNIERLSASVLVDGNYRMEKDAAGVEQRVYVERTPLELEKFRSLVATAIGLDRERADELTVISFPFAQDEQMITRQPEPFPWVKLIEKALLGLMLVGLFLLLRSFIHRLTKNVPALPAVAGMEPAPALAAGTASMMLAPGGVPTSPAALAAEASRHARQAKTTATATATGDEGTKVILKQQSQTVVLEDAGPSVETLKHQELLKRTTEYIVEKPDNATQVLRSWILDESPEKFKQ